MLFLAHRISYRVSQTNEMEWKDEASFGIMSTDSLRTQTARQSHGSINLQVVSRH